VDKPAPTQTAAWLGGDIDDALAEIRVPAFILDRDGIVRWTNARSFELFGPSVGRDFRQLVAPEALRVAQEEFTKQIFGKARTSDREAILLTPAGVRLPVQVHSAVLEDGRRVVGVFGVLEPAAPVLRAAAAEAELTPRQFEVLRLLARGASTRQIADALGISRETVRNHVRGLLAALEAHSRLEAIVEARRRGLIE
jgi:DNA-binding CsgD family transcriptional regulator